MAASLERYEAAAELMARTEAIIVEHPLLVEMETRINAMVRIGQRGEIAEKPCMAFIAETGCGKSTILRHCVGKLNAGRCVESAEIPALYVTLTPAGGKKALAQDILLELQRISGRATYPESGNEIILLERTIEYLRQAKCKVLVIDEFQHVLLSETDKRKNAVGETIKWLLIKGPCPIVIAGTDKANEPFRANKQLLRRAVSSVNLRPLDKDRKEDRQWFGKFFGQYFKTVEQSTIALNATSLVNGDTLYLLMEASGGVIGNGCKIISHAVYEMGLAGRTEIIEHDFHDACEKLLLHTSIANNPFATGVRGMKISAAA